MWTPVALLALALASAATPPASPAAPEETSFVLDAGSLSRLAGTLWQHSPALIDAQRDARQAARDVDQAHLLPNPSLGLAVGTIPVGPSNPPGAALNPLTEVMNYGLQLSVPIEVGKRGPRQEAAVARREVAESMVRARWRSAWFEAARSLARVAATVRRKDAVRRLLDGQRALLDLAKLQKESGGSSGLDVLRTQLEVTRLSSQALDVDANLTDALADCTQRLGVPCVPFADAELAGRFLDTLATRDEPRIELADRDDVRATRAEVNASRAAASLAEARALPDPTVSVGYLRDQFLVSGNQLNSFSVGVSAPLPLFDAGRVDAAREREAGEGAERRRVALLEGWTARERAALSSRRAAEARWTALSSAAVTEAEALVGRLEALARSGSGLAYDLVQARRTRDELRLELEDARAARALAALDLSEAHGALTLDAPTDPGTRP